MLSYAGACTNSLNMRETPVRAAGGSPRAAWTRQEDMSQSTDPHRPVYHFVPPANWMNDPNGLLQWRGRYHLFYQYNPSGAFHGTIHWGHAVSDDLVRWRDLPIALAPTPGGPDKNGVFSGCAVDRDGVPTLVYTGIAPEAQCLAAAVDPNDPDLAVWRKHPANPVIAAPPAGLAVAGFRDPFVWREADGWYCVIGSGIKGGGGLVLLYRSPDLVHWDYLHELCRGDAAESGTMWECPNIFPIGGKHVLLVSSIPLGKVFCLVGDYSQHRFAPVRTATLDHGGSFYAPQVMLDEHGRRLMWGWLREDRDAQAQMAAGWSGVLSLPTELSMNDDGTLCLRPVAELVSLRAAHRQYRSVTLVPVQDKPLDAIAGTRLEIHAVFVPGAASQVGLHLFESRDGAEGTRVFFDNDRQELVIDRQRSSLDPGTVRDVRSAPLQLAPDGVLTLRIFLDGSVIEVFANDRICLTSRVYPTLADSRGVRPFASGAAAALRSLDVWDMLSIWPSGMRSTPTDSPK
ncbi:MAG: glycoside hydrolase family 32 protein [Chloroflexi bacterium]|nr:glycoside hydrolase family 32 protein [Chloroflexota bacterium]